MGLIWDDFSGGIIEYALSAYSSLEPWTLPFIFMGIFGFVYGCTMSVTVTIVAVVITLGLYGGTTEVFTGIPDITLFLYIMTIVGLTLLFTTFIVKRRN